MTPTGCILRTFHPTIDTIAPNQKSRITPEPWLCIHKDGSRVKLASKTSEVSIYHRLPNTHNNSSSQLSSTHLAPPERTYLHLSLPHSPSSNLSHYSILQRNWSRISMMELSGLEAMIHARHRPLHLRHAGLKA
jgi:hypothetical protein